MLDDYTDAVQRSAVVQRLVPFQLKLALQLHANLDRLERMCRRHSTASCDAAAYEGAVAQLVKAPRSILVFWLLGGIKVCNVP